MHADALKISMEKRKQAREFLLAKDSRFEIRDSRLKKEGLHAGL